MRPAGGRIPPQQGKETFVVASQQPEQSQGVASASMDRTQVTARQVTTRQNDVPDATRVVTDQAEAAGKDEQATRRERTYYVPGKGTVTRSMGDVPQSGQEAEGNGKKGALSEFSMSAVIASALAAITSFVLQSKIGLAGSVIGVGVAAAASTIASQVYKGMLNASAKKLKSLSDQAPVDHAADETTLVDSQREIPAGSTASWAVPASLDEGEADLQKTGAVTETGTPVAPDEYRAAAKKRRNTVAMRRATIVIAAISIAAVLVYAIIVNVATSGQGIGSTAPLTQETSTDESQTDTQDTAAPEQDTSQDQGDNADATDTDADTTDTTTDTTTDDTTGTTTDTGTTDTTSGTTTDTTTNTDDSTTGTTDTTSGTTTGTGTTDTDTSTGTSSGTSSTGTSGTTSTTTSTTN